MVQHLLDEPPDRLPGLVAQVLGDAGLLQPGLIDQLRDRLHAVGRGQRQEQPERVGHVAAALPVGIEREDHLGVGPGRIGNQQPQFDAVGQQADALAAGQQHPLGDPQMAEAVRLPALGRGVEVLVEIGGPDAELGTVRRRQQVSARLPGPHGFPRRRPIRSRRCSPDACTSGSIAWLRTRTGPPRTASCARWRR